MNLILVQLFLLAVFAQGPGPQSLTVTASYSHGELGPDWRVRVSLIQDSGSPAHGTRFLDETGIVKFDPAPAGFGTLALDWLLPGHDRLEDDSWRTLIEQPVQIFPGKPVSVKWDLDRELATMEIHFDSPPADLKPAQLALTVDGPFGDYSLLDSSPFFSSFDTVRIPAALGTEFSLWAAGERLELEGTWLDDWTAVTSGLQRRTISFPAGRIEVRLPGPPPQGDADWSRTFLKLEADLRTTEQRAPAMVAVGEDGRGRFTLVRPGDYFLVLVWSQDANPNMSEDQVTRSLHISGGTLELDFASSGAGSAAFVLPPLPPPTGAPLDGRPALTIYRHGMPVSHFADAGAPGSVPLIEGLGRHTAVVAWGSWAASVSFELEPDRLTRVELPAWTHRIPVRLRLQGSQDSFRRLQVLDPQGLYDVPAADPSSADSDEAVWFTHLSAGTAGLVDQPVSGPRRVIPFEVPAALPEGQEIFEVVLRLDP